MTFRKELRLFKIPQQFSKNSKIFILAVALMSTKINTEYLSLRVF